MLSKAIKLASDNQNGNFRSADINYRLKICWNDNQEDFFETLEDLEIYQRGTSSILYLLIKFLYYLSIKIVFR